MHTCWDARLLRPLLRDSLDARNSPNPRNSPDSRDSAFPRDSFGPKALIQRSLRTQGTLWTLGIFRIPKGPKGIFRPKGLPKFQAQGIPLKKGNHWTLKGLLGPKGHLGPKGLLGPKPLKNILNVRDYSIQGTPWIQGTLRTQGTPRT